MSRIVLGLLTVWCFAVTGASAGTEPVEDLIKHAGNARSDEVRLNHLRALRRRSDLDAPLRKDLDTLIAEIERWIKDPALDYFGREVSRQPDYDFGISRDSPLYPLTCIYRGRMATWVALEMGWIWNVPERKRLYLATARRLFEQAGETFPENEIVQMYLGRPIPPAKRYLPVAGAPPWAIYQREGLERLTDIVHWWIDNRMRTDGQYGGGWGDDCEMWRWWTPILIGFQDPQINEAQARFSRALLSQPHMRLGYTTRMTDVEHTAEDSADAITPMMHIDPDNPDWNRRALRLAELMRCLWTGRNKRGFLQFKSTYFTAREVDKRSGRACDTVYHPRAVQPALLYWQRTGDAQLGRLFSRWIDTWVDAAARAERGKPVGVIPTAIHWPDGTVGGTGPDWWDPRNHGESTLYRFPSAMGLMMHTLLLTYHMTGDKQYLEPLRSMVRIRLDYLKSPITDPPAGSTAWCAARLGGLTQVAAKHRFLTGSHEFDALLSREVSPYVRYRLHGSVESLNKALKENADALAINFPGYTSEVRYTDRVLRFPALFAKDGILAQAVPSIRSPDPALLYSCITGDPGSPSYFPLNAVRWLTPPREMAALVKEASPRTLVAMLFHFGRCDRDMGAEFYLLEPGRYEFRLAAEPHGADQTLESSGFAVAGSRCRVAFRLPPRRLCLLSVRRQ